MNSTGRAANLKAILSDNKEIRSQVSEAIKVYEHGLKRDSRGIRLAHMLDPEDSHFDLESRSRWSALSPDERQMLHNYLAWVHEDFDLSEWQASASIMDQISISGVRYARKDVLKHDQDSHILFLIPGTTNTIGVGEIINIFQYWHTTSTGVETKGIYLVVDRFSPDVAQVLDIPDPYRQYPVAVGYLCSIQVMETRIIEATHVRGHFALTPMEYHGQKLMHVLPLNRVSIGFNVSCLSNIEFQLTLENWWLESADPGQEDSSDNDMDVDRE